MNEFILIEKVYYWNYQIGPLSQITKFCICEIYMHMHVCIYHAKYKVKFQ